MNAGSAIALARAWVDWMFFARGEVAARMVTLSAELAAAPMVRHDAPELAELVDLIRSAERASHPHPPGHRRTGAALARRTRELID